MRYSAVLDRLQNLINYTPSQSELGKILGLAQTSVSGRANRNSNFTDEELRQIEEHYNVKFVSNNVNNDCIDISVRGNLTASLGAGVEIVDETQTGKYAVSRKLMKDVGANINTTDFIPCEGDSMQPTIQGGALLMVDRSKTEVFDGKIYCIRLNNQLMAKRLQFLPPNKVKVISDNKDKYDAFYVDLSKNLDFDFAIIGEVKWYGTVVR